MLIDFKGGLQKEAEIFELFLRKKLRNSD